MAETKTLKLRPNGEVLTELQDASPNVESWGGTAEAPTATFTDTASADDDNAVASYFKSGRHCKMLL